MISFPKARAIVSGLSPIGTEKVPVLKALNRVLAVDIHSRCDSPPNDSSLKDGFALRAEEVRDASLNSPVTLRIKGSLFAGENKGLKVKRGEAIRIMTGAPIPQGADAVIPQELTREKGKDCLVLASTTSGRNILKRGTDCMDGELLLKRGTTLNPVLLGLLTGANIGEVEVFRLPRVLVVATGSELSETGDFSERGKIFPSNKATIIAWLNQFGIPCQSKIVRDEIDPLKGLLAKSLKEYDCIITSGGILDGEKDLVISILEDLGVEFLFKRVRMGPGKGVCMGRIGKRLIFNLPGGPPSNYMAFIFIALFGILRLSGHREDFPRVINATITRDVKGRSDWTQFLLSRLSFKGKAFFAEPVEEESRLKRIALSNSAIIIHEGISRIRRGEACKVALLSPLCQF